MNAEQREAFDRFQKSGYTPSVVALAMRMCGPMWWSITEGGVAKILHSATICFLNTGKRNLGVTAAHVYRGFLKDKETHGRDLECQMGNSTVYPESRLIDCNDDLDLATFDLPEVFTNAATKAVHQPASWPPTRIEKGEVVIYGGYPGVFRDAERQVGKVDFSFQNFLWAAHDVTDKIVVMHVDFANLYHPGHEGEPFNKDLGGISGGPVFRIVEQPMTRLELVGFVYEYQALTEAMLARHADAIREDGTIVSR